MKTLRPYQEKSQVILDRDTSGIDGSDMGTGKTLSGVERIRTVARKLGRAPRVLIIAPVNTHRQWKALIAEQFPSLEGSEYLRIIGSPKSDPVSWSNYLLKKKLPGIYIMSWEAMRGSAPKTIKVVGLVDKETGETVPDPPLVLNWWNDPSAQVPSQYRKTNRSTDREIPPGFQKPSRGGASRGYGKMYKGSSTLTKQAVQAAAKAGDVPPWTRTGTWDLVIADESHRMARKDSINKLTLTLIKTTHKLAASATFAGNKPEGAWSTLNWLWPKTYNNFWHWANTFLRVEEEYISNDSTVKTIVGEIDPGTTWLDIPCKVRHRVEDIRGQLPDVIERIVEVDMGPEQRRIYDAFATESLAWIDDHPMGAPLPMTQRIRLRQAALGQLKVTLSVSVTTEWMHRQEVDDINALYPEGDALTVVEDSPLGDQVRVASIEEIEQIDYNEKGEQPKLRMIKDILDDLPEDEPVMIYTHSAKWAVMAAEHLDALGTYGTVRAWTGALTKRKRDLLKDAFGTPGGPRILVTQIQSVAEGTDGLQHRCACEIWASPTEDGLINDQARGRLNRDGQKRPIQRWLLHAVDSIDTGLEESLNLRRAQMKAFYRDNKKEKTA